MRLTQLAVHCLLYKPSVGCLLLPKSLISSKMASRIHYDISPKNHKSSCHPEFISGSYQLLNNTPNWSDSEHTQSSQTSNDERFRMTNFLSCSVNSLRRKPSEGCLLLPKSLISCKMASRIHYDLANTHNSFNSELGRSHNFFYVHFFFLFAKQKEKMNQKRKTRQSKHPLRYLSSKFSNRFA